MVKHVVFSQTDAVQDLQVLDSFACPQRKPKRRKMPAMTHVLIRDHHCVPEDWLAAIIIVIVSVICMCIGMCPMSTYMTVCPQGCAVPYMRYPTGMCCGHAWYPALSKWALTGIIRSKIAPPWHDRHLNYLCVLRTSIELENSMSRPNTLKHRTKVGGIAPSVKVGWDIKPLPPGLRPGLRWGTSVPRTL